MEGGAVTVAQTDINDTKGIYYRNFNEMAKGSEPLSWSNDGKTMNWTKVAEADEYHIDVYKCSQGKYRGNREKIYSEVVKGANNTSLDIDEEHYDSTLRYDYDIYVARKGLQDSRAKTSELNRYLKLTYHAQNSLNEVKVVEGKYFKCEMPTYDSLGFSLDEGKIVESWKIDKPVGETRGIYQKADIAVDTDIYAQIETKKYSIFYNYHDADEKRKRYDFPYQISHGKNFVPSGPRGGTPNEEFIGWSLSENGDLVNKVIIKGDTAFYAVYKKIKCKVTYYPNGGAGNVYESDLVKNGTNVTLAGIEDTGFTHWNSDYKFAGWGETSKATESDAITTIPNIQEDKKVYAIWVRNMFNVSFDANGGSGTQKGTKGTLNEEVTLPAGDDVTIKAPEGKKFKGWSKTNTGEVITSIDKLTGDVKLYAIWVPNMFNVSFDANGGSGTQADIKDELNSKVTLPTGNGVTLTPPKGKKFKGWSKTNTGEVITSIDKLTGDITLYAIWDDIPAPPSNSGVIYTPPAKKLELTFELEGGTWTEVSSTITADMYSYSEKVSLPKTVPQRDGYEFVGWEDAEGKLIPESELKVNSEIYKSGKLTLKAVWKEIEAPAVTRREVKRTIEKMDFRVRTSYTKNGNIKIDFKVKGDGMSLDEIKENGYTVKTKFYRSLYKSKNYKRMLISNRNKYINTMGKKGKRYYYKAVIEIRDKDGKVVVKTKLKDCKYGTRSWKKA